MLYMAAHYALFDPDTVVERRHRRVEVALRTVLHNRYRYQGLQTIQIITELRRLGKWETCTRAFSARFGDFRAG
jgi:hypothetical protein